MAKRIRFTQVAVGQIRPPQQGRDSYIDAKTPGLILRVGASGSKTFHVFRRMSGRPTRVTLGAFPGVTVEQARKEAARVAGALAAGVNPAEKRRQVRGEMTLGQLFDLYLRNHAQVFKRTWREDQAQFDRYAAAWRTRKLSAIRKADVAALHAKIGRDNGPYAANRLLALLTTIFNYAASDQDYEGPNPCKGTKRFKEQSRDRFLRADEIQAVFAAMEAETEDTWRDFFTLALLIGARRANLLSMAWLDVELTRGLWRIGEAESKNKEPLVCILHPAAVDILHRRAAANAAQDEAKRSPYVFPGRGNLGHVVDPVKPWERILTRAGIQNVRIHDLRRTFGSWQAAAGASLSIIGKTLGHRNVETTAIYARLNTDSVRASVTAAGDAILAAANGDTPKALPGRGPGA